MSKIVFEEEQRFNHPLVMILMVLAIIVVFYTTFKNYNGEVKAIIFGPVLITLASVLVLFIKLRTRIDEKGVHVKFIPFINSWATYNWSDLYSAEVVKYSPLGDYGGWGYRISFKGKGKAFNTRGNMGIQIQTDEGKIRLIGTQKAEEAKAALAQYFVKQ